MWLHMISNDFTSEENINNILINNKIKPLINMFELIKKNVKCIKKRDKIDMDLMVFEASMVQMQLQKSGSTLFRKSSNDNYVVACTNIKNENGEYFSSLIDTLNENDRIVFVNVIIQKYVNSTCFNSEKTVITIRPENNPLVFVFKYKCLSPEKLNVMFTNLSQLTNSGTYSLVGHVKKIIKYSDEDYMLLRILCNDKSLIKTRKYPHSVQEFKQISNIEKIFGVNYDFSSNKVDILINNPCIDFISLVLKQRIFLNNIKVKYISDLHLYSLHVKGHANNIRIDPVETNSINSLRPLTKQFLIPNELKPAIQPKKKHIVSNDIQSASKDINQKFNKIVTPRSKLKLSTKQGQHSKINFTNSSSDDNVNLSPCRDFSPSKYTNDTNAGLISNNNLNDHGSLLTQNIILNSQTNNQIQKCSISSPIIPLNEASSSKTKEACLSREKSPDCWSSDGSCSPSFFNTQEVSTSNVKPLSTSNTKPPSTSNIKPPSLNQHPNTIKEPTRCIGPCRLIFFEPNLFDSIDIVHGYCIKCFAFIPKSLLEPSNKSYKCPKCFNVVKLTFFFKIIFLYGKDEEQAVEVCCYSEKAERVIQKLTKKPINVENYLSNYDYKKSVADIIKSMLCDKTKVNIVICESPNDKTNVLLSIDTKYVITTSVD